MMTNACDRSFAVEFDPIEVISGIAGAIVADVVEQDLNS